MRMSEYGFYLKYMPKHGNHDISIPYSDQVMAQALNDRINIAQFPMSLYFNGFPVLQYWPTGSSMITDSWVIYDITPGPHRFVRTQNVNIYALDFIRTQFSPPPNTILASHLPAITDFLIQQYYLYRPTSTQNTLYPLNSRA